MTEHEAKYNEVANIIGIEAIKPIVLLVATKEQILSAFSINPALNTIALQKWDSMHQQVRSLVVNNLGTQTGIKSWSLSQTVCLLKHVARYYVAELPFETEAK